MISLIMNAKYNEHGIIEAYEVIATKTNLQQVQFNVNIDEVKFLLDKVKNLKTVEEKREEIIKQVVKEEITTDKKNIDKFRDLIERWQVSNDYKKDDLVKYNDIVFKSKKNHKSDYETIPINDSTEEFWERLEVEEIQDEASDFEKKIAEYNKLKKEAEFFSRDKTYKKDDLVVFYNKLYKSLFNRNSEVPERSSKWLLIEEPKKA